MSDDGGLARLQRRIEAIPSAIRKAVEPAVAKSANELAAVMKTMAPKDDGDLVKSIKVEDGYHALSKAVVAGGELTTRPVREGADASYDYAFAQELGTTEMQANPFFYPAKRLMDKRIKSRLKRAAAKAVRDNWGKS